MYYCIVCRQYHPQSTAVKILNTRTENRTQMDIPIGYCHKEFPEKASSSAALLK